MSTSSKTVRIIAAVIASAILLTGSALFLKYRSNRRLISGKEILCVMEKLPGNDVVSGLVFGYNYHILKKFAENEGAKLTIMLPADSSEELNYIERHQADMAVVPDTFPCADSIRSIVNPDFGSRWVFPQEDIHLAQAFNRQLKKYRESDGYHRDREMFLRRFTPLTDAAKGKKVEFISPYDSFFMAAADSTVFDWRFLAAIAYQESGFHIEANSRRGAGGLMQLMPATAARMSASDILDPQQSIGSASAYLQLLYKRYRRAANTEERLKFTLAGYNAGEGRIKQFTSLADTMNVDRTYWENVSALFDEVEEFKGVETRAYVNRVMKIYKAMCKITEP